MKKDKNNILIYVVVTYLLFWFMVLGVCGVAVFVFDAPQSVMKWLIA
ncbi:MAG TPA: CPBP family intramembrane metalloprotease, partial [Acholeplasmataceae bacterium]|nr:CPBP family intramembrane metalloprotease [Acholeplasmataceae bacterium]